MADKIDYLKFYDGEQHLLDVGEAFRHTGHLDARDFYMMLVWKANRAKNKHRERLKTRSGRPFEDAVARIAERLHFHSQPHDKLKCLMEEWGFRLPTATAILTLLYPELFTIYDILVCEELGWKYKPYLSFSEKVWGYYLAYKQRVIEVTPVGLSLRDKDRFLIGKANFRDLEKQCRE